MSYLLNREEIVQTNHMIDQQHLDVRTITMGINLQDCASEEITVCGNKIYDKICSKAENLVKTGEEIEREFGIPIVNKRISVTPISIVAASCKSEEYEVLAKSMDRAAKEIGVNYIGGYSALVQKGFTESDRRLIRSIPTAPVSMSVLPVPGSIWMQFARWDCVLRNLHSGPKRKTP